MGERFDVFVSFGHADAVWVRALVENLRAAGLGVFFDDWEITPGEGWVRRFEAGVRRSRAAGGPSPGNAGAKGSAITA